MRYVLKHVVRQAPKNSPRKGREYRRAGARSILNKGWLTLKPNILLSHNLWGFPQRAIVLFSNIFIFKSKCIHDWYQSTAETGGKMPLMVEIILLTTFCTYSADRQKRKRDEESALDQESQKRSKTTQASLQDVGITTDPKGKEASSIASGDIDTVIHDSNTNGAGAEKPHDKDINLVVDGPGTDKVDDFDFDGALDLAEVETIVISRKDLHITLESFKDRCEKLEGYSHAWMNFSATAFFARFNSAENTIRARESLTAGL